MPVYASHALIEGLCNIAGAASDVTEARYPTAFHQQTLAFCRIQSIFGFIEAHGKAEYSG